MANYRNLQYDFSGGELDPIIEANITNPIRQIGLKKSENSYHLPYGAVVKRPPEKFRSPNLYQFTIEASTTMSIEGASIKIFLLTAGEGNNNIVIYDDTEPSQDEEFPLDLVGSLPVNYNIKGCHIAVNGNLLIVTKKDMPLHSYTITKDATEWLAYTIEEATPSLVGWKWGNPSSCMFAAGRLFLSVGNTLLASRTPEDGANRFFDFTLADYIEEGGVQVPHVYASHAIEVHEMSLESTEISWMANLGRVIVGTPQALFMSSDDIITPQTFHLIPTSYIGCSKLQPKMIQSYLLFTSKDEEKIYIGQYNDQIKGLVVQNVTDASRHLFLGGIKTIEVTDYPYVTVFALTNDNQLQVGTAVPGENGLRFAFSRWTFKHNPTWIFINRQDKHRFHDSLGFFADLIMRGDNIEGGSTPISMQFRLEYKEIARMGKPTPIDNLDELYLDEVVKQSFVNPETGECPTAENIHLEDFWHCFLPGDPVYMLVFDKDNQLAYQGEAIFPEIPLKGQGISRIYMGTPYIMRIQLMQQLMPNNLGIALKSLHSIERLDFKLFKSFGGQVFYNGKKVSDLRYLTWGKHEYKKSLYVTDPDDHTKVSGDYFTGVYSIENPVNQTDKDELEIVADEIYPFNLLAVGMKYNVTEVN